MKSTMTHWMMLSLGLFLVTGCGVSGCGGDPGVQSKPKDSGLQNLKRPTARETSERIKTAWDRFQQADDTREKKRAIQMFNSIGAGAESEIAKLQEVADSSDYDEEVREAAKRSIENIKKAVEDQSQE